MRLSSDYYPEVITFTCEKCGREWADQQVTSIEADDVCAVCPSCQETHYERVIWDY